MDNKEGRKEGMKEGSKMTYTMHGKEGRKEARCLSCLRSFPFVCPLFCSELRAICSQILYEKPKKVFTTVKETVPKTIENY